MTLGHSKECKCHTAPTLCWISKREARPRAPYIQESVLPTVHVRPFDEKAKADSLIKNLPENLSLYFDHYRVDHAGEK